VVPRVAIPVLPPATRLAGATPGQAVPVTAGETGVASGLGVGIGLVGYLVGRLVGRRFAAPTGPRQPAAAAHRRATGRLAPGAICAGLPLLATAGRRGRRRAAAADRLHPYSMVRPLRRTVARRKPWRVGFLRKDRVAG
jgi:hypothetical protein